MVEGPVTNYLNGRMTLHRRAIIISEWHLLKPTGGLDDDVGDGEWCWSPSLAA